MMSKRDYYESTRRAENGEQRGNQESIQEIIETISSRLE